MSHKISKLGYYLMIFGGVCTLISSLGGVYVEYSENQALEEEILHEEIYLKGFEKGFSSALDTVISIMDGQAKADRDEVTDLTLINVDTNRYIISTKDFTLKHSLDENH